MRKSRFTEEHIIKILKEHAAGLSASEVWRFRILTLVDDFTRECLGLVVDTSLTAPRIVRELDRIVETRGCPRMIVSDNGTEFTSNAILRSLPLKLSTKPFCIGLPGAM